SGRAQRHRAIIVETRADARLRRQFVEQPVALVEQARLVRRSGARLAQPDVDLFERVEVGVERIDLARGGALDPLAQLVELVRGGTKARSDIVGRLQELGAQRPVRRVGGQLVGGRIEVGEAGLDTVRLVAHCAFDFFEPSQFRRGAPGLASGDARILYSPRVYRTMETADVDSTGVGVAAIEDRIAGGDGFHHLEPAPRIAGRLGVGDIVADRRERTRIGLEPAVADAEQVAHCTPPPRRPAGTPPTWPRNCRSTRSPRRTWRMAARLSAVRASAMSRKLSAALDPKMSSASFACRIDAISWRRITASNASAALRSPSSPPPAAAG